MRTVLLTAALALVVPAFGPIPADASSPVESPRTSAASDTTAQRAGVPKLKIRKVVRNVDHPWDVRSLPGGDLIFTQRDRATLSVLTKGKVRKVDFPSDQVWVQGETGLMGLEVDPEFATNRRVYTCQGGFTGGGHDVRVMAWTLSEDLRTATSAGQLIGGFPTSSGRHGGCRLLIDDAGSLLVGTGDAAIGTNPRDLDSLGGKTLRLDRMTGAAWPTNPYAAEGGNRSFVHTYGHRNVQGLTQRSDGTLWSVEQGTSRDDEVNLLKNGGDYGYNPVPGYNESVPMTDQSLPGKQVNAAWSSGDPTLAASGGGFVYGSRLGAYNGTLAVAILKDQRVLFLKLTKAGKLRHVQVPSVLRRYGRIRTVVDGPGSSFYVTTDNGDGNDAILRVRPHG